MTNKVRGDENSFFDLKSLRLLVNSEDLVILNEYSTKVDYLITKREKNESFVMDSIDINNKIIDSDDELYPFAAEVLKQETIPKYVLYDVKLYLDEVDYQRREVFKLSDDKSYKRFSGIIDEYKRAFTRAMNDGIIPKGEEITVRYPQKKKKGKKRN